MMDYRKGRTVEHMEETSRDPVSITSARAGRSVDLHARQRRYLISMMIRTLCFVLAVVATGPLRWAFIAGAIFLPYIAVILANNGSQRTPKEADVVTPEPIGELSDRTPHQP